MGFFRNDRKKQYLDSWSKQNNSLKVDLFLFDIYVTIYFLNVDVFAVKFSKVGYSRMNTQLPACR